MNPSIDPSMKKHLIALLYVVAIVLLFVKWVSFWGYKFGLIGLSTEADEPIFLLGLIVSGLSCLYSLIRSETGGRKFELPIGFIITVLFAVFFMIVINAENSDWGALGPQLTAAPTAELILCAVGAALCFLGESDSKGGSGSVDRVDSAGIKKATKEHSAIASEGPVGDDPASSVSGGKCHYCGSIIPNGSAFCPSCGKSTITHKEEAKANPKRICPVCGAGVDSESAFCPFCGGSMGGLKSGLKRKRIEEKEPSFVAEADEGHTVSHSPESTKDKARGFSRADEFD